MCHSIGLLDRHSKCQNETQNDISNVNLQEIYKNID